MPSKLRFKLCYSAFMVKKDKPPHFAAICSLWALERNLGVRVLWHKNSDISLGRNLTDFFLKKGLHRIGKAV